MLNMLALTAAGLLCPALVRAQFAVPDLTRCGPPVVVHVSEDELAADALAPLKTALEAKGHRLTLDPDKADRAKIPWQSYVYMPNGSTFSFLKPGSLPRSARFPMTLADWKARLGARPSGFDVLDEAKLEAAVAQLAELERKKKAGLLTVKQKELRLRDLFWDVFVDEDSLAGNVVMGAVVFGPRKAIPYFGWDEPAMLEEGYGTDLEQIVAAVPFSAVELKRRVQQDLQGSPEMDKKIVELGDTHVASEAGLFVLGLMEHVQSYSLLTPKEKAGLYEQFAQRLPNCRQP